MNDVECIGEMEKHQAGKGDVVQAGIDFGETLVIACQAPEAGHPSNAALDHPAPRQQDKAALGLRELDDFQGDSLGLSGLGRSCAGVALIRPELFLMLVLGGVEQLAQDTIVQVDDFVGDGGHALDGEHNQSRVAPPRLELGQVAGRHLATLAGDLSRFW